MPKARIWPSLPSGISQGELSPPRVAVNSQNLSVLAIIAFSRPERLLNLPRLWISAFEFANHVFRVLDSYVQVGVARIEQEFHCHSHQPDEGKLPAPSLGQVGPLQHTQYVI